MDGPLAGLVPVRPGRRVAAFLIDGATASVVVMIASMAFFGQLNSAVVSGSNSAVTSAFGAAIFGPLVVWVAGGLLMVAVEGATGATIGNAAVQIRTVSVKTGGHPGFGRAFGRRFVEQLGSVVLFGGPLIAASSTWDLTPLRQGWQDKAAGTTMVGVVPRVALHGTPRVGSSAVVAPLAPSPPSPPSPPIPDNQQHLVASESLGVQPIDRRVGLPVAQPELAALPIPDLAVAEGRDEPPKARKAGVLIADVPGFESQAEPQVELAASIKPSQLAPPALDDLDEDLDHTRMSPTPARATGSYELAFDTGETVIVDGTGLVGRNPAPRAGESVEHVVPIIDPARSVSKTHLMFGAGPAGFWVSDRDSTNGTRTVSDDGVTSEVSPDVKTFVPVGGTVEFGERRFTVAQL
ncbi:MAG: RDD family protein [Propionicimonas sp.]